LVQLQADLGKIEATGTQLVAISYDPVEVLARFTERRKITYPLLSDPGSKTIRAYGILNTEAKGKAEGIPYPGTFVLENRGVIRAKLFLDGYRERVSTDELLKAIGSVK
jgi:peroxiredoxin Q/BCP